ncbi:YdgH/BhsA/McbA-like domain containing protein [Serratia sp. UGAL515B_01]|uniref:YdgH/BhsA/McbA-like domain containing protein n=1 Tax=Serratia sp. UGAL515B_01 TaxID=2986763 RepID=UPI002952FC44|nr:YdgH/BhsA/McbA-like domain containing protein [Serratia sp. UGAL515B_01]WON76432.1 DUF1471 domain-containing protein [Serratia sp. UGAL515B_01]
MRNIKRIIAISILSLISFGSFAQSISATGSTLDTAEARIAAKAKAAGAKSYTITSAHVGNRVYMTAELSK